MIKIDIEGAEADMLAGAVSILLEHQPTLVIELHGTNAAVDEVLQRSGYAAYVIGSSGSVLQAPWNAMLLCVPANRQEETHRAMELAAAAVMTR